MKEGDDYFALQVALAHVAILKRHNIILTRQAAEILAIVGLEWTFFGFSELSRIRGQVTTGAITS